MAQDMNVRIAAREQSADKRASNFDEVGFGYNEEEAVLESNRCLNCKAPRCVEACPVHINIPKFIMQIKDGDVRSAYKTLSVSSALPAVCGRVCPQETQCEGVCVRGIKGEPVAIGKLERYAADTAIAMGESRKKPQKAKTKKLR